MKKILFKIYLLFIGGAVFFSCHFGIKSPKVSNEIVLIFKDCPPDINNKHFPNSRGGIRMDYDISYMDSTMTLTKIVLKKAPYSDTITIPANSKIMEVIHFFNVAESASYLFHKGDSVLITYEENVPNATVLNRKTKFPEINYNIFIREKVQNNKLPAIFYYRNQSIDFIMTIFNAADSIGEKWSMDDVIKEWMHEYKLIDSLYNQSILSDQVHNYRRNTLIGRINSACEQDSAFLQDPEIKKMLADAAVFIINNDSLLQYAYYRDYIQTKINNHTKDIQPIMDGNSGVGGSYPNFFARFDTINNLDFLSSKTKQYFLKIELESMLEHGDKNDIEKYCEKYISITRDSLYVNRLLAKNNIDLSKSDELLLIDRDNNQTNFQEVLEKNKGKVIYVDLWASFCEPCKRSMPDAKQLREEYKNKDVVFVYLAWKDEEDAWKAAEQKLEVNYLSKSYFITNSKTARFLTDLNVRYVPRYLLFNKKGELGQSEAPGPHGKEIRNQLNKLLNE